LQGIFWDPKIGSLYLTLAGRKENNANKPESKLFHLFPLLEIHLLSSLAARLEVCGKQKKLADAPALVEQIAIEITRVKEYLSQ
jgi:hypothetical protein